MRRRRIRNRRRRSRRVSKYVRLTRGGRRL